MPLSFDIRTNSRTDMVDITPYVQKELAKAGIIEGICLVYIPHTTAGVTINEGADPSVCRDIISKLNEMLPADDGYLHSEGNSDSHIKASLVGNSLSVIVENGLIVLGTWQKIFFCEFDGPRSRKVWIKALQAADK
jgi:secondary thiamine-phosphate synthase enzyme